MKDIRLAVQGCTSQDRLTNILKISVASHKLYLSLAMSAEGVSWEPVLLLVTQEPQLGTPKAGLSLGTILLSKCVGF